MLNYKLIVTALLDNLTEDDFRDRVKALIQAEVDNPTIIPGLSPTAAAETTKVVALDALYLKRDSLIQQQKTNTGQIYALVKEITDDITSKWVPQVQTAVAGDENLVKLLGFGIKGEDNQQSEPEVSVSNSKPDITFVDINHYLQIALTIRNNVTGKIGLPFDAKRLDIYMSFLYEQPLTLSKMQYVGSATRGKFTVHFPPEQLHQTVWFIAVYVPKTAGATGELSGAVKSTVV